MSKAEQRRRYMRDYQARRRGTKRSYATEVEQLKIMLAWERGELSSGCASKALGCDIVGAREMVNISVAEGVQLCREILGKPSL